MFDLWSKFQSGVFNGNLIDLGNYDQCLAFSHQSKLENVNEIKGQYCLITYRPLPNKTPSENSAHSSFDWTQV